MRTSTLITRLTRCLNLTRFLLPLGVLGVALIGVGAALALTSISGGIDDSAVFELDGNAVEGLVPGVTGDPAGDDWATVNGTGGNAALIDHTGVIADFGTGDQMFTTGGSKDILGINRWKHATRSGPPDKDDLTNAYAAAYKVHNNATNADELWIYFGADRFDNSGDALLGFWFFQDGTVGPIAGGDFAGHHKDKDLLVLASFTGGGTTPTINVREWSCSGTGLACDTGGSLVDVATVQEKCNPSSPSGFLCAITNTGGDTAPWTYNNKSAVTSTNTSGLSTTFPAQTFFEGGINISSFFNTAAPCFNRFLAETRSSTDLTKSVNKDFVLGNLSTCKLGISKTCGTGQVVNNGSQFQYPISITLTNTGFGTLQVTSLTDTVTFNDGTSASATFDDGAITVPFNVTSGTPVTFNNHTTAPSGKTASVNNAHADATTGTGSTSADAAPANCTTPALGALSVTKTCATQLPVQVTTTGGQTVIAWDVRIFATVCNEDVVQLDQVTVTDDKAGALSFAGGSSVTLPPKNVVNNVNQSCATTNNKDYLPSTCDNAGQAGTCSSTDTVTASGRNHITGATVPNPSTPATDSKTCHLCPNLLTTGVSACSTGP